MKIIELIDIIWDSTTIIEFGDINNWDENTFKSGWFDDFLNPELGITKPNRPGLYWFETNTNLSILERPLSLPVNGCHFLETSELINSIFGTPLLTLGKDGSRIIYNGHEKNVMSRVRSHFSLANDMTGALGLSHYPVSNNNWRLIYFTSNDVPFLNAPRATRDRIALLLSDKPGRNALESAWRVKYGWPPLSRQ